MDASQQRLMTSSMADASALREAQIDTRRTIDAALRQLVEARATLAQARGILLHGAFLLKAPTRWPAPCD
jgi:hypothetical protein